MVSSSNRKHLIRKLCGVLLFFIELNLVGGTIFGLGALFKVLPKYGIYDEKCTLTILNNSTTQKTNCDGQMKQYQNSLALGLAFYNIPSIFIGILIDKYGCRLVKLIGIIFHVVGWLTLALATSGQDYLLYFHTVLTSLAGKMILLTSFASSAYFTKSRALVSSLFTGASTSSAMWFSIFQILIDNELITLANLSYIWISVGILMLFSAFLFLDWKIKFFNLPYQFKRNSNDLSIQLENSNQNKKKWYKNIQERLGIWQHLTSPLYISVVLFLSVLLLSSNLLSIIWYPWIYHITEHNRQLTDKYTFIFNVSNISSIVICPISGFLLGFRADQSKKQKLLNISILQTFCWLINVALCVICMFASISVIMPTLVIYFIARAITTAGCQAIIATFFPPNYIGRLSGIMWTFLGALHFIQYGLITLTNDIEKSWRAWIIVLSLVILTLIHLIQIWWEYIRERNRQIHLSISTITWF